MLRHLDFHLLIVEHASAHGCRGELHPPSWRVPDRLDIQCNVPAQTTVIDICWTALCLRYPFRKLAGHQWEY